MSMKKVSFWFLVGIMLGTIVLFAAGCTEQQVKIVDKAAEVGQAVVDSGQAVLDSPGGLMIPEPMRTGAEVVGAGISGLITFWLAKRSKIRGVVLKSVVQAVDKGVDQDDTKSAVKTNLKAAGVEYQGRKIIEQMKKAS